MSEQEQQEYEKAHYNEMYCSSCQAMFEEECCCCDDEEKDREPDGYECMSCGHIQDKGTGFGCDKCSGPVNEWYS